ncbi:MAG: DoxX family protein [Betaproteobacteria bacterium]|jgi:putative oxidoreductase|nr:DoxX family protein [Betaproteobacteria bacterium]
MNKLATLLRRCVDLMHGVPHTLIALLGRFSIAAVFWLSGQTKVQGFSFNLVKGEFQLAWPRLSDSAVDLFRDEYRLPLIAPEWGAVLAAFAEHLFPALILIGLATRFSALALLIMTGVIQFLVYPDAYATHGVWATVLLYLIARGPGAVSLDALIARTDAAKPHAAGK